MQLETKFEVDYIVRNTNKQMYILEDNELKPKKRSAINFSTSKAYFCITLLLPTEWCHTKRPMHSGNILIYCASSSEL